jgi:hypothetical protein
MNGLKEGDLVVHLREGYTRSAKEVILIRTGLIFVSVHLGEGSMYSCNPEELQKVTKEDNPEYFI